MRSSKFKGGLLRCKSFCVFERSLFDFFLFRLLNFWVIFFLFLNFVVFNNISNGFVLNVFAFGA